MSDPTITEDEDGFPIEAPAPDITNIGNGAERDRAVDSSALRDCPRCMGIGLRGVRGKPGFAAMVAARVVTINLSDPPSEVQCYHSATNPGSPGVCDHCGGSCLDVPYISIAEWLDVLQDPEVEAHLRSIGALPQGFDLGHARTNVNDLVDNAGYTSASLSSGDVRVIFNCYLAARYAAERALTSSESSANDLEL